MQACLSAGKVRERHFHNSGVPVKHCLSARKDGEISLHHSACTSLFKSSERKRKQFSSPLEVLSNSYRHV